MVEILFEDNHLIAAFKKSGQTVQPEPGKPLSLEEEVKDYIAKKYEKKGDVFLGVIHRLDMPVEGIVLFAKTSKSLVRMNELFQQRKVQKFYEAWVENIPSIHSDLLSNWLKRDEKKNYTKVYDIYEKYLQTNSNVADPTLIWIHYIRFVARVEDMTAARKMFKRAREDPNAGFQLFIAQADLEFFHTKVKSYSFI